MIAQIDISESGAILTWSGVHKGRGPTYIHHMAPSPRPSLIPPREPLPPSLLEALRGTRPWITYFAVLGLLGSCLAGFGGVRAVLFAEGFWRAPRGWGWW